MKFLFPIAGITACLFAACGPEKAGSTANTPTQADSIPVVAPRYITGKVRHDTDDPAIWINPGDAAQSLILGTDKDEDGALYVFDLQGNILEDKVVHNLKRPNNVDVEYGLMLRGKPVDIAVVTERLTSSLRIYSVPEMQPLDGGGIPVFVGETGPEFRDLMGIALYKHPLTGKIFAIVGRKNGPKDGTYLWQYELADKGNGQVKATLVRKFGAFSGKKEIESIAVDDSLGYVYYSDEQVGVRQYFADPEMGNQELVLFATHGFAVDNEGISFYAQPGGEGFLLVSDQGANQFHIFSRQGPKGDPYAHQLVRVIKVKAMESDGSETVSRPLGPDFPNGLFVAMSTDSTFHLYRWEEIFDGKSQ